MWVVNGRRRQWLNYVASVYRMSPPELLEEYARQVRLDMARMQAETRRAEMDYLAGRVASEMKKG